MGRESASGFSNETAHQTTTSTGSFDEHADGLEPETTYKARAVAVADDGDSDRGDTLTFTTNGEGTFWWRPSGGRSADGSGTGGAMVVY